MLIKGLNSSLTSFNLDTERAEGILNPKSHERERIDSATTAAPTTTRPQSATNTNINRDNHRSNLNSQNNNNNNVTDHFNNSRPNSARIYTAPSMGLGIDVSVN